MKEYICINKINAEPENKVMDDGSVKYGYCINGTNNWIEGEIFDSNYTEANELNKTAILMNSKDYVDRFVAEYKQLSIRYERLSNIVETWKKGGTELLGFKPDCDMETFIKQLQYMKEYKDILEYRAVIEKINLTNYQY